MLPDERHAALGDLICPDCGNPLRECTCEPWHPEEPAEAPAASA